MVANKILTFILIATCLLGCTSTQMRTGPSVSPKSTTTPIETVSLVNQPSTTAKNKNYQFPTEINPEKRYLFYLHGKIIEDQGLPAISPVFGKYRYQEILDTLSGYGFEVISEQRPKDTDAMKYARVVGDQLTALINAGTPASNITIVGASKGASITIYVSHAYKNQEINYVLLGICHPDIVEELKYGNVYLTGNVLSIFDMNDEYAGSCQELFAYSQGKGLSSYNEIVLDIGTGHGILYEPLDDWIYPTVGWANKLTH